ncbi:hypothetical protein FRC03_000254 [Tulasnella sp. 419]|nr:hypothetical protein FRC03_000254 [Tulasnella sp. 419]
MQSCLDGGQSVLPSHGHHHSHIPQQSSSLMNTYAFPQSSLASFSSAESNAYTQQVHTPVTESLNYELTSSGSSFEYFPPPNVNPFVSRPQLQIQTHSFPRYGQLASQEAQPAQTQCAQNVQPSHSSYNGHAPQATGGSNFSRDDRHEHIHAPVPQFPATLREANDVLARYSQQFQNSAGNTFTSPVTSHSQQHVAHTAQEQVFCADTSNTSVIPIPLPSPLVLELKNKDPHSYPWQTTQQQASSPQWLENPDLGSSSQWTSHPQSNVRHNWQSEQEKEISAVHFQLVDNYTFPPATNESQATAYTPNAVSEVEYSLQLDGSNHVEHTFVDAEQPGPKRSSFASRRLFKAPITPVLPFKISGRSRAHYPRTPSPNKKLKSFSISRKFFPKHGSSPKNSAPRLPITPPFTPYTSDGSISGSHDVIMHVETTPSPPRQTLGTYYSEEFPDGHHLNTEFVMKYELEAVLGSGGYGFVMTAVHLGSGTEVAVKFILRERVPPNGWAHDPQLGMVPIEVVVLRKVDHPGIIRFIEFFSDGKYCYLIQELHGSPWSKDGSHKAVLPSNPTPTGSMFPYVSPPLGGPSMPAQRGSLPNIYQSPEVDRGSHQLGSPISPASMTSDLSASSGSVLSMSSPGSNRSLSIPRSLDDSCIPYISQFQLSPASSAATQHLGIPSKPKMARRASHDLFECIEQHKRLPEGQAKFVFAQVVNIVDYLHSHGICHRDIKDENLVIDENFRVKLIDFGSAVIWDVRQPPPYYTKFFGTVGFASSEILRQQPYRAPHAEIWTLGVLLAFLVTGESPFRDRESSVEGRVTFGVDEKDLKLSSSCEDLIRGCLRPNPDERYTIQQIKRHKWLHGALSRC